MIASGSTLIFAATDGPRYQAIPLRWSGNCPRHCVHLHSEQALVAARNLGKLRSEGHGSDNQLLPW